ncbi:MAG: helix-turn-helix transcriptional regulator [Lachnospiraceae bacterium]|nr:helix-turn-helix transcriptional regulator [Lachnospiraceae bacterium]
MNFEEYLKGKRIKISQLSRKTEIPYTTIGDIVKGRTDIDNVSVKILRKISDVLNLSMEDTYRLLKSSCPTPEIDSEYKLSVKNGHYYISKQGIDHFLCKNTKVNAFYITEIAATYINNIRRNERMESWTRML